jgi:MFS family permease
VSAGRLADRVGVRKPMLAGSIAVGLGTLVPLAWPGLPSLVAAAVLTGGGFMLFQVPTQRVTGEIGAASERVANFAMLSLGYSFSGFLGPLVAGFGIDTLGFRGTFGLLALVPLVPIVTLARDRLRLPAHTRGDGRLAAPPFELLARPGMRAILAVNALFSLGWELHTVFVPIYGAQIGLPASAIGAILSAFAAATFLIRFGMPWIARRATERHVLAGALLVAAAAYMLFPFSRDATMLAALSFMLGLGLGSGQPIVMSMLSAEAPPGRMGEAAGLRMALIQALSVAVPLVFGAIGSSLGVMPVFWTVAALLATGGAVNARRRGA